MNLPKSLELTPVVVSEDGSVVARAPEGCHSLPCALVRHEQHVFLVWTRISDRALPSESEIEVCDPLEWVRSEVTTRGITLGEADAPLEVLAGRLTANVRQMPAAQSNGQFATLAAIAYEACLGCLRVAVKARSIAFGIAPGDMPRIDEDRPRCRADELRLRATEAVSHADRDLRDILKEHPWGWESYSDLFKVRLAEAQSLLHIARRILDMRT